MSPVFAHLHDSGAQLKEQTKGFHEVFGIFS